MKVTVLTRSFRYSGIPLADLDPSATVDQIKAMYAPAYPELNNSIVEGPTEENGNLVYEFRRAVGTKGVA